MAGANGAIPTTTAATAILSAMGSSMAPQAEAASSRRASQPSK